MGFGVLVRLSHDSTGKVPPIVILCQNVTTIGRRADVRLDSPSGREISRIHARISRHETQRKEIWILEDSHSLNGTFVNSRKIHSRVLTSGDEIIFGGGPDFKLGDLLECSEQSQCRYSFFVADPFVKFAPRVNPNAPVAEEPSKELCSICYQPIIGAEVLPCRHAFCIHCIHSWVEQCRRCSRPPVCPMCRSNFLYSQLSPLEVLVYPHELEVWSLEGTLADLKMPNAKAVKQYNIFRQWTDESKKWFWNALSMLDRWHRRVIFLHLTKATVSHILQASELELLHAMQNLGIATVSNDKIENQQQLLLRILKDFQTHK
jgi:hypothetical protein